jgi:cystathionine beta-lyase
VTTSGRWLHCARLPTRRAWVSGIGVGDVETLLRSLPSMAPALPAHDSSVARVCWLDGRDEIAQVHPAPNRRAMRTGQ